MSDGSYGACQARLDSLPSDRPLLATALTGRVGAFLDFPSGGDDH